MPQKAAKPRDALAQPRRSCARRLTPLQATLAPSEQKDAKNAKDNEYPAAASSNPVSRGRVASTVCLNIERMSGSSG